VEGTQLTEQAHLEMLAELPFSDFGFVLFGADDV
jgi:hypothetical protein